MLGLFDAVGWIGGAVVVVAYVLVSTDRVASGSAAFQALNIVGAAMVGIASLHQNAMPSAGWNLVWVIIGLQSLTVGFLRKGRASRSTAPSEAPAPELVAA